MEGSSIPGKGRGNLPRKGLVSRLVISCPLGFVEIEASGGSIRRVHLLDRRPRDAAEDALLPVLEECARQLREYFAGKRRRFDLPLDLQGTDFERSVWEQLLLIPYGKTASYKDVARAVGRPAAMRAVGAANGKNPVAVIVPCHRVIGHDGRLVGYGGGLWRKRWLLDHEKPIS